MKNLIVALLLTASFNSAACTCMGTSLEDYYDRADVIFSATMVRIDPLASQEKRKGHQANREHSVGMLQPKRVFKGRHRGFGYQTNGFREVYLIIDTSPCSVTFEEGQDYLVFGKAAARGIFTTNYCMGSASVQDSTDFVRKLFQIKEIFDAPAQP